MKSINASAMRALIIVLYPYLSQYQLGGTGIDIGTMTIVALLVSSLDGERRIEWEWLAFCLYCILTTLIANSLGWMTEISLLTSAVRLVKMLVAFLYVSLSKDDIDEYSLKRFYYKVGDIATYAIFLQTVLYNTVHISLRLNHGIQLFTGGTSRPCSIFGEPSQYAYFILIPLAMTMFSNKNDTYYKDRRILYSVGILLSTSGQGYAILAGMWLLYILYKGIMLHQFSNALVSIVTILLALIVISRIPIVQQSVSRLFSSTSETGFSTAVTGRLTGFDFINELSTGRFLIGTGFGNRASGTVSTGGAIYYNGISSIISGSGIIGLIIFAMICVDYLRKVEFAYIAVILAMWALMFSANLFYAPYIVLYFSVIKKCGMKTGFASV